MQQKQDAPKPAKKESTKYAYIGQTSRSISARMNEHREAVEKEKWPRSGITQYKEKCKANVDWENPTVITTMNNENENKLNFDLKVWQTLEIKHHDAGPGHGLNENYGAYVKTYAWNAVFHHMDNEESERWD